MSKTQTQRKVVDPRPETSAERLAKIAIAKQQFLDAALNMSWQLAVTIIVPVFIGAQLDKRFKSEPTWTLVALFLAVAMAAGVVVKTLRSVKANQNKKGKPSA
jgi:F0F1-type ATP synthase assembly protein I